MDGVLNQITMFLPGLDDQVEFPLFLISVSLAICISQCKAEIIPKIPVLPVDLN